MAHDVRLRIPELLDQYGWRARDLADALAGRVVQSVAYKLAAGEWRCLKREHIAALCDVLNVEPEELLTRKPLAPDSAPPAKRARGK